jgi:hypothetical protein
MDAQIGEIYRGQVISRAERDGRYREVLTLLLDVCKKFDVQPRPDAVCFLVNNLVDMIVGPMSAARDITSRLATAEPVAWETLFPDIEHDLGSIIESSLTVANERERREISATSAIVGLARVIDNLRVNRTKLWGR